jgi:hypothetical protein
MLKRAKKVIVKKPGALTWVINLLLPLSSLTMSFLHNSTTINALYWSHISGHTYIQKKKTQLGAAAMTRSMPDSLVHCNVACK